MEPSQDKEEEESGIRPSSACHLSLLWAEALALPSLHWGTWLYPVAPLLDEMLPYSFQREDKKWRLSEPEGHNTETAHTRPSQVQIWFPLFLPFLLLLSSVPWRSQWGKKSGVIHHFWPCSGSHVTICQTLTKTGHPLAYNEREESCEQCIPLLQMLCYFSTRHKLSRGILSAFFSHLRSIL